MQFQTPKKAFDFSEVETDGTASIKAQSGEAEEADLKLKEGFSLFSLDLLYILLF